MNMLKRARRSLLYVRALCLAVCATALPLSSFAADAVNIEGTWKISVPQGTFKPVNGNIPLTAAGRERYQQNKRFQAKGQYEEFDYATARCASPGLPRLMLTPDRFRVWQRQGLVAMQFEWNRLQRQIDLGGLIPQTRLSLLGVNDEDAVGRATPISKGHWEGDTLVATTQGFADNTLVDDLVPHGYDMKLTERIRLKDADTLENHISIEDPEYFTRPWQTVVTYKRQPDELFPEDVCLERHEAGQPGLPRKK